MIFNALFRLSEKNFGFKVSFEEILDILYNYVVKTLKVDSFKIEIEVVYYITFIEILNEFKV